MFRPLGADLDEQTQLGEVYLRGLMRAVVTNGSATFLRGVPGGPVLAKTGTAEHGSDSPPRTHAWMLGIHGDLAVADMNRT